MKRTSVRIAEPKDAQNYNDWLKASSHVNLIEPEVYSEPTCITLAAEINEEPVLMTSFRLVMCVEALAPRPGLSPRDEALALREMWAGLRRVAAASGIKELVFQCADPRLQKFISKRGFKKIETDIFRMKVSTETTKAKKKTCKQ